MHEPLIDSAARLADRSARHDAALGSFLKPTGFPDQRRKYTVGFENAFAARADSTSPPYVSLLQLVLCRTGSAPSRVIRGSPCFSICEAVAHREGSRPRDPLFAKPSAFPDQGRKYIVGFENAFAARGDSRPPCRGLLDRLSCRAPVRITRPLQTTFSVRLRPDCFSKKIVTRAISAGVIPLIRPA
jgi:hypothetical protein